MAELSPNLGLNLPVGSDRFDYDKFLRQNFQILDDKVGKSTTEVLTATEGQTVFTLANSYALGTDSLSVEVDGVKQLLGSGYTETSTTSITLSEPLVAGAKVKVVILGLDQGQDNRFDQIESSLADIASLKPSGKTDSTDSVNAQNMINTYNVLYLGKGSFTFTNQITVKEDTRIIGKGMNNTLVNSTFNGFAFSYKSTSTSTLQAPQFKNFTLTCYSGIQLNDPTKDMVDGSSGNPQPYAMRALIERVKMIGKGRTGVGIEWVKCFDGHIRYSEIDSFDTGIKLTASDICSVKHNRIALCNYLIDVASPVSSSFGSQSLIQHNDLLEADIYFIRTSDRFGLIMDNYCEAQSGRGQAMTFFDVSCIFECRILRNRVEHYSTDHYLANIRTKLQFLEVEGNNSSSGTLVGKGVQFTNPTTYYGYSFYYYRTLIKHGLNNSEKGFPYNYDILKPKNCVEVFSPSREGLACDTYGQNALVSDNAFVFPAVSAYTSTAWFSKMMNRNIRNFATYTTTTMKVWASTTAFNVGDVVFPTNGNGHVYQCTTAGTSGSTQPTFPLTENATVTDSTVVWQEFAPTLSGTFKISVVARADVANQTLTIRPYEGRTNLNPPGTISVVIDSTNYKKYTVVDSITTAHLALAVNNNNDTGNTGNIYIKEFIIEHSNSNKGTLTYNGDGSSTSKTIPHGLGKAPSSYFVHPASADAGTAGIKYYTVDATNITVYFNTAPISGTNNVSLNWKAEL